MNDEYLLAVSGAEAAAVDAATLPELGLKEREHLQAWVVKHPGVLGDGVAIVTCEYDKWQTAQGEPVLDRLDVLGIAPGGRLVVAELKRDLAPHTVHMQAINYAAMVSRLTSRDIAELWAHFHATEDGPLDVESVTADLETRWLLTAQSIKSPRIVLVAASYPVSVTASVVWLNEQGVDISLIRFRPYQLPSGDVLVSFTRTYPVPSVEDFTIGRRVDQVTESVAPGSGPMWDLPSLQRLAAQGNEATIAMMDLCAEDEGAGVSVLDIAKHADITPAQVRGQLAGLTMRLKNPKYGFPQTGWPTQITWLPGGVASYSLNPHLVKLWKQARGSEGPQIAPTMEPPNVPPAEAT